MSTKLNDELTKHLEENATSGNPQQDVPVIVTVKEWHGTAELEKHGLRIGHTFESIYAVSGTARPEAIEELAGLENVAVIEYDGEMRALPQQQDVTPS